MKHLMISAALAAALGVAGCHKSGTNANQDVTNPGDSAPVNAVQDVAATGVGMASAVTNGLSTTGYAPAAAMGDMYEVEAGKIAVARAKSPAVKHFGQMLVDEHTASMAKMKGVLPAGVTPPTGLDNRRNGMLNNLKAAGDADFDMAFLHQQLSAHTESLTLHQAYAKGGDNPALKTFASGAVPMIEKHLKEIKDTGGAKLEAMGPG